MCTCGHELKEHGDRAIAACASGCPVFDRVNAIWDLHNGEWTCPCEGWAPTEPGNR